MSNDAVQGLASNLGGALSGDAQSLLSGVQDSIGAIQSGDLSGVLSNVGGAVADVATLGGNTALANNL